MIFDAAQFASHCLFGEWQFQKDRDWARQIALGFLNTHAAAPGFPIKAALEDAAKIAGVDSEEEAQMSTAEAVAAAKEPPPNEGGIAQKEEATEP